MSPEALLILAQAEGDRHHVDIARASIGEDGWTVKARCGIGYDSRRDGRGRAKPTPKEVVRAVELIAEAVERKRARSMEVYDNLPPDWRELAAEYGGLAMELRKRAIDLPDARAELEARRKRMQAVA